MVAGPGWTGWGLRFQAPTQGPAVPESDHCVAGLSTESGSGAFPEKETEGGGLQSIWFASGCRGLPGGWAL